MLKNVSWVLFLEGVGVILLCYYVVIGLLVFKDDIRRYFTSRRSPLPAGGKQEEEENSDNDAALSSLESLVHTIEDILGRAGASATKEQIVPPIKQQLAAFPGWRKPLYKEMVIKHTIRKAKEICGVGLTAQELGV